MLALTIAALVLGILNLLVLGWTVLCIMEMQVKEQITDYSLAVCFYNDTINSMQHRDVTPEEEFTLTVMQEKLQQQARAAGLNFVPFKRPEGL